MIDEALETLGFSQYLKIGIGLNEFPELCVSDFGDVHPETVHRHIMNWLLIAACFLVVTTHRKGSSRNPDHARWAFQRAVR